MDLSPKTVRRNLMSTKLKIFISLQLFILLILLLHDWVSFGPFNDVAAVHKVHTIKSIILQTCLNFIPYFIAFILTVLYKQEKLWSRLYVVIAFTFLFIGELWAWWIPYFSGGANEEQINKYDIMFGNTHAFLPEMNGITPNTLHFILHSCTLIIALMAWSYFKKKAVKQEMEHNQNI
jgi:hypothetical protein